MEHVTFGDNLAGWYIYRLADLRYSKIGFCEGVLIFYACLLKIETKHEALMEERNGPVDIRMNYYTVGMLYFKNCIEQK